MHPSPGSGFPFVLRMCLHRFSSRRHARAAASGGSTAKADWASCHCWMTSPKLSFFATLTRPASRSRKGGLAVVEIIWTPAAVAERVASRPSLMRVTRNSMTLGAASARSGIFAGSIHYTKRFAKGEVTEACAAIAVGFQQAVLAMALTPQPPDASFSRPSRSLKPALNSSSRALFSLARPRSLLNGSLAAIDL